MKLQRGFFALVASLSLATGAACSGGDSDARKEEDEHKPPAAKAAVTPTGKVDTVRMITDGKGERYDPVDLEVTRGDTLRFTLQSGVHNIHFVAAKNPAGAALPPASEYLQLPGQAKSYLIDFPEGHYYYQCDIHVLVGMVGHITVEDHDGGE